MAKHEMMKTVEGIVSDLFMVDPSELRDDMGPAQFDLWDSLNHLRLITAVESALNVELTMQEIQSIDSIGRLREVVGRHAGTA